MAAPPIPLLWAKLERPRLPAGAIARSALIERLAAPGAALTVIVAPAGYGKTTLAVQLAQRIGGAIAWLSLEPPDRQPARFWTYVAAALTEAGVADADRVYELLSSDADGIESASLALRAAIEAHEGPVTLVLDDVQEIDDEALDATIGQWLRHPLANLRVVCVSRGDLALPVGRLRSLGLLTEARVEDLAFGRDESAAVLAGTFGLVGLTPSQLDAIERRTEGWPVGLYLAGLAVRDEPDVAIGLERFTGDTRHLSEYLATEAMDGLTDDARAFALATSILSVLHPDLCDAVTDGAGSLRILRELAADNVFTSALDDGATMFRYHPLFREHLRSVLEQDHPELVAELHRKASVWFETTGSVDRAIEHATAAGQTDRAEQLIIARFLDYANAGHFETVKTWVDALGPRADRTSETALAMGWLALNLRRYDEVDAWLAVAEANASTPDEWALVELQRPAVLVHRARHLGDVGTMTAEAERALAAERTVEFGADRLHFAEAGRIAARSAAASAAYWAGEPAEARDLIGAAIGFVERSPSVSLEQVFCYQYLALVAADEGDHDGALAHADQTIALVGPGKEASHLPVLAHLARSIALTGMGRPVDAADALALARRVAGHRREPLYDATIELQQARLDHLNGDQEAARAALRSAKAIVDLLPDPRFDERLRATENAIRFVAPDADALPVGARELTDRERAVLTLLPHGLSRRELARQLHVSENTVKTHLTSIRHKLGVAGRASIVDRAVDLGLLPTGDG